MNNFFTAAVAATTLFAGAASAATVSGNWFVSAVNVVGIDRADSAATQSNFDAALAGANAGDAGYTLGQFFYSGELSFSLTDTSASPTIGDWLSTGVSGATSGASANFATFSNLNLSSGNIDEGTATTTFFQFANLGTADFSAGDLTITHDDGVLVYDDLFAGTSLGGFAGPNGVRDTEVAFGGGFLHLLYAASNGNPSVLNVNLEVAPVPLPAGLPLMLMGLGGMVALRRRHTAKAVKA